MPPYLKPNTGGKISLSKARKFDNDEMKTLKQEQIWGRWSFFKLYFLIIGKVVLLTARLSEVCVSARCENCPPVRPPGLITADCEHQAPASESAEDF